MKPTLPNIQPNRRSLIGSQSFATTDYQFRPNSMTDFAGRCHGNPDPSFRGISGNYFKDEAPAHFVSEAAVFVLITVTALVAMVQGVRAGLSAFGLL